MKKIYFDAEMQPLLDKVVDFNKPYKQYEELEPFNIDEVKLGNLKDEDKIAAKIAQASLDHSEAVKSNIAKHTADEKEYWGVLNDKAALNPETGRVLTIGTLDFNDEFLVNPPEEKEADVLKSFWSKFTDNKNAGAEFIGWNIFEFDLPYMIIRSRLLKVKIPFSAYSVKGGRWYWNPSFIDLMPMQGCGVYAKKFYKLEKAAKFYGVERPREHNIHGKDFWKYWTSEDPDDQVLGLKYLQDDLLEYQSVDQYIRQHW